MKLKGRAHDIVWINLKKECEFHYGVSAEEIAQVREMEKKKVDCKSLRINWWEAGAYYEQKRGNWLYIYISPIQGDMSVKCYTTNTFDNTKNTGEMSFEGSEARKHAETIFKKFNGEGMSTRKAFGTSTLPRGINEFTNQFPEAMHAICPKSPYYLMESLAGMKMKNKITKLDYSSNFPSQARGRMPDSRTGIVVDGWVDPTPEYPFVFRNDGSSAELDRFDTRDWRDDPIFKNSLSIWEKFYLAGDDCMRIQNGDGTYTKRPVWMPNSTEPHKTLMMKASEYTLDDVVNYLYKTKREAEEGSEEYRKAKLALNAWIGTYGSANMRGIVPMDHVRNVIIARAVQQHYETYWDLTSKGNIVISMIVDSFIMIQSDNEHYGTEEKYLGALHRDYEKVGEFCTTAKLNQYYAKDSNGNLIDCKHGGLQMNDEEFMKEFNNLISKYTRRK